MRWRWHVAYGYAHGYACGDSLSSSSTFGARAAAVAHMLLLPTARACSGHVASPRLWDADVFIFLWGMGHHLTVVFPLLLLVLVIGSPRDQVGAVRAR